MKIKTLIVCMVLVLITPSTVSAGTISKGYRGSVKASTEADSYNPDSDQLPEWLILPEGVNENSLQFSTDSKSNKIITSGSSTGDKWVMKVTSDDKKVTYSYYLDNKKQFSALTSDSYSKINIYNASGKKVKSASGKDFFDESIDLNIKVSKPKSASVSRTAPPDPSKTIYKARKNTKLSKRQLEKLTSKVGFRGNGRRVAVAIATAESRGHVGAVLCNFNGSADNPRKPFTTGVKECKRRRAASVDRGLWQINNYWHRGVKDSCTFSARCNAKAAYKISNHGSDWKPWSTWWADAANKQGPGQGAYRNFL